MKTRIRRKPAKVTITGMAAYVLLFGTAALFIQSVQVRLILLVTLMASLGILFISSVVAPYLGGLELEDGKIEVVTGFGGIIRICIDKIDHEKSVLSSGGLVLVPLSGERLVVSAAEYSKEDILRVAHYAGVSEAGWSQEL